VSILEGRAKKVGTGSGGEESVERETGDFHIKSDKGEWLSSFQMPRSPRTRGGSGEKEGDITGEGSKLSPVSIGSWLGLYWNKGRDRSTGCGKTGDERKEIWGVKVWERDQSLE